MRRLVMKKIILCLGIVLSLDLAGCRNQDDGKNPTDSSEVNLEYSKIIGSTTDVSISLAEKDVPVSSENKETNNIVGSSESTISVDTTELTHEQVMEWLTVIADEYKIAIDRTDLDYEIEPFPIENLPLRETNSIYYITRFNSYGDIFYISRINSSGKLEIEINTLNPTTPDGGRFYIYRTISSEFMDVSGVQSFINSRN
ncbi:hypothetical protein RU93_GL000078 [Enterococcus aquimarinus]|uniref:Uncharacterized protein n=2 Tax=Enterococcus aquimarinus TaxID=328396 RepID=A0A1L8QXB4_9ENTE|nr:hypothetical protein RU93_GL000078 [Enterococcus aquimarinus]